MPPKRPLSPSPSTSDISLSALYVSRKIEDRSSTFIAYFSATAAHRQLQSHPDLTSASHRILAWRKPSSQRTLTGIQAYNTGSDDDGENYAGKKLLKLLDDYKVEGAIVVARWYGGTLLGPVRFQHIESAAKEAIRAYLADKNVSVKKAKVPEASEAEDETLKGELIEELKSRDESIVVLRNLLDDKLGKKKEEPGAIGRDNQAKPAKLIDYEGMPFSRLKQIDKARDNTIAFLLKKIDEIEEQGKVLDSTLDTSNGSSSKT